jgi:hypothetical protein
MGRGGGGGEEEEEGVIIMRNNEARISTYNARMPYGIPIDSQGLQNDMRDLLKTTMIIQ